MHPTGLSLCVLAPALVAQSQATFYAAYQDGLDAEGQGRWSAAAAAYRRAIELRPASAARVLTYGNNLLKDYFPHTRLARCLLHLGEDAAAGAALERAARHGEPPADREALALLLAQKAAAHTPTGPPPAERGPIPSATAFHPPPDPPAAIRPQAPEPPPPAQAPAPSPVTSSTRSPLVTPIQAAPPPVHPVGPGLPTVRPGPTAPPSTLSPDRTPAPPPGVPWWAWLTLSAALALGALGVLLRRRTRNQLDPTYKDPEQVGPYRIERLLGRGGFASTYLARHTSTKAQVALKLLHPYRQDDPEFLRRFRQEARLGTMLDHPNLVRMLDPGPDTGAPWLAMEFITGRRLDQVLAEDGPLSLAELLRIAHQIASAMAHAHTLGIVHRDLKPGNIIFDGDQAKVMDFGISRIVDSTTLTTTYAFLGTPKYAAPEAQLKAQVGPAADRYAFGIILFELIAGHPPFDGETPFEILDHHQRSALPDLLPLRPDCPVLLADLVQRLCRKQPDQRPEDDEVLTTLDQVGQGLPGEA